jgi:hypothetical protein
MTDIIYTHRTRDGHKARIIGEIKDDVYPIVGAILLDNDTKEYVEHFTKELKCIVGDDSEYDLFEYSPWNDVKVDTPILVSNSSPHVWVKRHFAKYEMDMFMFGKMVELHGQRRIWLYTSMVNLQQNKKISWR